MTEKQNSSKQDLSSAQKPKRAVIYLRVSSAEQASKDKSSLETQRAESISLINNEGYTFVKEYLDIQTGEDTKKERDNYELMLKDGASNIFDVLVCWRPDRLFRGLIPAGKLKEMLEENNLKLEGSNQPCDISTIATYAMVATMELTNLKARTKAGKRAGARLGRWQCGLTKFGYDYIGRRKSQESGKPYTGKLQINEEEAKIVRQLFDWVDQGKVVRRWCEWANREGIPTKRKSLGWTAQQASEVLTDPCYTGEGYYGKKTSHIYSVNGKKKSKVLNGKDPIKVPYPPIIDVVLFQRVNEKLKSNIRKNKGSTKHYYPILCTGNLSL